MSINFCHIAPITKLYLTTNRNYYLTLAHLVEESQEYVDFYLEEKQKNPNMINIMDNSAFEMYKQNRPMYPTSNILSMAKKIKADYVVMSDYPGEDYNKTIKSAEYLAPIYKENGFGTFFVPQSEIGDIDGLIKSFDYALNNDLIDYIGVSILAAPNAFGVEKNNKLQRYLSRWKLIKILDEKIDFISRINNSNKKLHFLGMTDGPNEIELMQTLNIKIDSWDSSAAVWGGMNVIKFDNSPTGLIDGKFEKEVDFYLHYYYIDGLIVENMNVIDKMCEQYHYDSYLKIPDLTGLYIRNIYDTNANSDTNNTNDNDIYNPTESNIKHKSNSIREKVKKWRDVISSEIEEQLNSINKNNEKAFQKDPFSFFKNKENKEFIERAIYASNKVVKEKLENNVSKFKYNENMIIDQLKSYISNTYNEHYVGKNNIQTLDIWESLGIAEQMCQGTAIKYLMRVGKKDGYNEKDLMKALHFIVLLMYYKNKKGDDNE